MVVSFLVQTPESLFTNILNFRLHIVYGIMRLIALLTDIFVVYHAKGLKLTEEEQHDEVEDPSKPSMKLQDLSSPNEPFIKQKLEHRRIPSGGIATKILHKMDDEDDFQQKRPSLASDFFASELSQSGSPKAIPDS